MRAHAEKAAPQDAGRAAACEVRAADAARWVVPVLAALGICAAFAAAALSTSEARAAGTQDWPPFVLVGGLLLVGLTADDDGLFEFVGRRLASLFDSELYLFLVSSLLITVVTAVLNLDTSVAFLTPVLVHLARARRSSEAPYVYSCLFLSNAGSVLLPGSNLTNLIVLGHLHLSGITFALRMAPVFVVAVLVTTIVVGVAHRRDLIADRDPTDDADLEADRYLTGDTELTTQGERQRLYGAQREPGGQRDRRKVGVLGVSAVLAVTVVVLMLRSPAPWVAGIGFAVCSLRLLQGEESLRHVLRSLGAGMLVGLFGVAVALGTLGRSWRGPKWLLDHLGPWATAALGAITSVVSNNLPAASLLSAHVPPRPYSLLIGLDLGPNLFVTGSLSAFLWWSSARRTGTTVSFAKVARLGAVVVPLSVAASVGVLVATGSR